MAKKHLPAWQQVLLVVIESVPQSKNGHDAWNKLNDEEKAAVMDFLTEHCGEDAQTKLEETCAMAKPSKLPEWLQIILGIGGCRDDILALGARVRTDHVARHAGAPRVGGGGSVLGDADCIPVSG